MYLGILIYSIGVKTYRVCCNNQKYLMLTIIYRVVDNNHGRSNQLLPISCIYIDNYE